MQFVVNKNAPGTSTNSFCWFCHAVPKLPSIEDVSSIQDKRGKATFHREYRCLHLYHQFVPNN